MQAFFAIKNTSGICSAQYAGVRILSKPNGKNKEKACWKCY